MGEPGLIDAYLVELGYSVARLPDRDDIVAETEDHLRSAVERFVTDGVSTAQAEQQALARFGSAALVSRVFMEEAKRGAAVSTQLTRRAGIAAMAAPVVAAVGQAGNITIERGAAHGVAVGLLVVAFGLFGLALWGMRLRHGGLGRLGHVALGLFIASPLIAAPFAWGAPVVFAIVQLIVLSLLGVGMLRARILPPGGVALLTLAPNATVVTAVSLSSADIDAKPFVIVGLGLCALGLAWVGWAMWREPALDVRPHAGVGPLPV